MNTNTILRNTILGGIFIIPFIPFLVTESMLFPFITGKNFAFRIIVEIIFALWVILALRDEEYRPRFSWLLASLAVFTGIVGFSNIFAIDPFKAFWSNFERMEGYVTIIHLFLFFLVMSSFLHLKKMWNYLFYTWMASGVFMSIYGLFQLSGAVTINQGGVRVDGTLGNATYLAVLLLCTIFIGFILYVRKNAEERKSFIWYFIPITLLELVILYYTATRGAVIGLIGGLLVTAILIAIFEKEDKILRKISIGTLIGVFLIILTFLAVRNTSFVRESPVLSRFASLSTSEIKTQGRYFIWPMAIKGFQEKPVLGWGQEGFNYIFNKNYDPRMYSQEQWFDRAHSVPLDWLVASGGMGFLAYLLIIFFTYWYIWKGKDGGYSLAEKSVLTGLVSGYLFHGIFVFDNLVSYILFFTILSMVHAFSGGKKLEISEKVFNHSMQGAISGLLVVLLSLTFYFANWKPIRASQTLIDALRTMSNSAPTKETISLFEKVFKYDTFANSEATEQLASLSNTFANRNVSKDVQASYIAMADRELTARIKEAPQNARYHLFRGIFYRTTGQLDKSLIDLEKAAELSPKKQTILFELGSTLLKKNDGKGALEVLKKAYELEPSYTEARIIYGITALAVGEKKTAEEVLNSVPEKTLYFDDRIVNVFMQLGRWNEIANIFTYRIENGEDTIDNYMSLAVAYLKSGNRDRSIIVLNKVAVKDPSLKEQVDYFISEIRAGRDPSEN